MDLTERCITQVRCVKECLLTVVDIRPRTNDLRLSNQRLAGVLFSSYMSYVSGRCVTYIENAPSSCNNVYQTDADETDMGLLVGPYSMCSTAKTRLNFRRIPR